jgi:hypothetical protein
MAETQRTIGEPAGESCSWIFLTMDRWTRLISRSYLLFLASEIRSASRIWGEHMQTDTDRYLSWSATVSKHHQRRHSSGLAFARPASFQTISPQWFSIQALSSSQQPSVLSCSRAERDDSLSLKRKVWAVWKVTSSNSCGLGPKELSVRAPAVDWPDAQSHASQLFNRPLSRCQSIFLQSFPPTLRSCDFDNQQASSFLTRSQASPLRANTARLSFCLASCRDAPEPALFMIFTISSFLGRTPPLKGVRKLCCVSRIDSPRGIIPNEIRLLSCVLGEGTGVDEEGKGGTKRR